MNNSLCAIFCSICYLLLVFVAPAQSPINDIEVEYDLFKEYRFDDPDQALEHAANALQLSKDVQDSLFVAKTSRAVGWLLNSKQMYDSAYFYLIQSVHYANALGDKALLRYVQNDAGLNRLNLSVYDDALEHFMESLKLREELKDYEGKGLVYNNIGLVYYQLNDYKEALSYFRKGLQISRKFNDIAGESMNLVNIGLSYHLMGDYDEAMKYFKDVVKNCETDCPGEVEIQAVGGIGIIHYYKGEFDKAKKELKGANELSALYENRQYMAYTYHYLANIAHEENSNGEALKYLALSDKEAKAHEDLEGQKNNLELSSKIYASLGQYDKAYELHVQYVDVKDSLLNADVVQKISDIHVGIQKAKDETIIFGQNLEIAETRQQLYLFGFTMLSLLILTGMVYRNNKYRKKNNKNLRYANETIESQNVQLSEINERLDGLVEERTSKLELVNEQLIDSRYELDNFLYKTSHDIRGPLASLQGVCNVGLLDVKDNKARDYLIRLRDTASNLNSILSRLQMVNNINNMSIVKQKIDFEKLVVSIIAREKANEKEFAPIAHEIAIDENIAFQSDQYLIELTLNNLISNGFKFYNKEETLPFLKVCIKAEGKLLTIKVIDNGIGIDPDKKDQLFKMFSRLSDRNRAGGIGLYLVKCAVERLSGKVGVYRDDEEGSTVFKVELPMQTAIV